MQSEEKFYQDSKNKEKLKNQLVLLSKTNVNTQIEDAKQSLASNIYLQHMWNVSLGTMNMQEEEIEELEQKNDLLAKENVEYKNKFGELDEETLKKLRKNHQLVPVSPSVRMNKILAKMDKVNKELTVIMPQGQQSKKA